MNAIPYISYFILLFLCSITLNGENAIKKSCINYSIFLFFCFVSLCFFGLRGFLFTDWISYYEIYNQIPNSFTDLLGYLHANKDDMGFIIFSFICKLISPNYFFLQFISFLVDFIILYCAFRDLGSKNIILNFVFVLIFKGFEIEFNLLRNSKSIALFIYSLQFICNKKSFLKYEIINLIGFFFHFSAIIYLPLYFILGKEHKRIFYFIIFSICVCFMALRFSITKPVIRFLSNVIPNGQIISKLFYYSNSKAFSASSIISPIVFERIFIYLLLIYLYPKLKFKKINVIAMNIFTFYFIFNFIFWDFIIIVQRLPLLFICSNWILFPEIFSLVIKKQNKYLLLMLFFLFGSFKLYRVSKTPLMIYTSAFNEIDYKVKVPWAWKYIE